MQQHFRMLFLPSMPTFRRPINDRLFKIFVTLAQLPPCPQHNGPSVAILCDYLQIRIVFIRKWLICGILHFLVVLLKQSFVNLDGRRS